MKNLPAAVLKVAMLFMLSCGLAEPSGTSAGDIEPTDNPVVVDVRRPAAHEALIREARASAALAEQIRLLNDQGWSGGDFSGLRVLQSSSGDPAIALKFSTRAATIELLYAPTSTNDEAQVLVRPANAASMAAVLETLEGPDRAEVPQRNEGKPAPETQAVKAWSCTYTSKVGFNALCFSSDNLVGFYQVRTMRTGVCDPALGSWYADYQGHAISCPYPNTAYTWRICGLP